MMRIRRWILGRSCIHQRKYFIGFAVLISILLLLLWLQDLWLGILDNFYGNFHWRVAFRPVTVRREDLAQRLNISVFVIVDNAVQLKQYALAQQTLGCYCALHGYPLIVLDLSDQDQTRECPQEDFMFRRHCALANYISAHPELDYMLFLDGDIGVINPNHLLEDYLPEERRHSDLIFYERIFNGEIMAGSYFLRNTPFARQFLHFWANYTFQLPKSFHGTDNGAIHAVFLDIFCGQNCSDQRQKCQRLWEASRDFGMLEHFTACCRNVLGSRNIFHSVPYAQITGAGSAILLTDSNEFWARDGWLTGNCWSPNDFLFHGWQNRRLDRYTFAGWHSSLAVLSDASELELDCHNSESASRNWPYKDTFLRSNFQIQKLLNGIVRQRMKKTLSLLKGLLT